MAKLDVILPYSAVIFIESNKPLYVLQVASRVAEERGAMLGLEVSACQCYIMIPRVD